jgi:hypothetical protein
MHGIDRIGGRVGQDFPRATPAVKRVDDDRERTKDERRSKKKRPPVFPLPPPDEQEPGGGRGHIDVEV